VFQQATSQIVLATPKFKSASFFPYFSVPDGITNIFDMVHSRATTPALENTSARDYNPGYAYCPRTGVKVHDGKSLDPEYNKPKSPDFLFCGGSGRPQFNFCFRTGLHVKEVSCGQTGTYFPATVGGDGKPLPRIFCTGSGNFLGDFCPITGKNKAQGTKDGKLIAKTWDSEKKKVIPHKFCLWSGNKLKATSDSAPGASSPIKPPPTKKTKSQSAGSSGSGLKPPIKPSTNIRTPKKPTVKKSKATTATVTAVSKRKPRERKQTERLSEDKTGHPAVKKAKTEKAAPKKKAVVKTGAGIKKAATKKPATKKATATPKKAAPKKAAAKKPAVKKPAVKKSSAGVKKAAANTKKKIVPKEK
jgi:hypothetical protein